MADAAGAALVDARGLKCPLPAVKTQQALATLPPGGELVVLATDPMARIDIPHLCQESGHRLVDQEETAEGFRFRIQRSATP